MNQVPSNNFSARVLLVEDNEVNQKVACRLLERKGIRVAVAENGQEALEKLAAESFDVVLMDIQMPVMDGISATMEIRRQERLKNLPIIALTANSKADDRERCLAAGMNDYIAKPIEAARLYEVLSRYLPQAEALPEQRAAGMGLPLMAGIDSAAGLRRMGGDQALYLDILFKFYDRQQDFVTQMNSLLAAGSLGETTRLAHTLKGLAGSIGAVKLQQMSLELEDCLRENMENTDIAACAGLLLPVGAALQEVLAAISGIAHLRPEATPGEKLDREALAALIGKVEAQLSAYDANADGPVERLCSGLAGGAWAGHAARVRELTARYEYDAALEALQDLAREMGMLS